MREAADFLLSALLLGAGATAIMDLWTIARRRLWATPAPDFGLVGRWIAYMPKGKFHHAAIGATPSARHERLIGWAAHYLTGIVFAIVLLGVWGSDWASQPSPGPALIVGIGSVAAPFLLMQPGMGAGIAASRTAHPAATRIRSLVAHGVFGLGLYATGCSTSLLR